MKKKTAAFTYFGKHFVKMTDRRVVSNLATVFVSFFNNSV